MASTDLPIHSKPEANAAKETDDNNKNSNSPSSSSYQTFPLGSFPLQSGSHLPSAHLAYTTLGSPSSPAILYPTWYSGLIASNLWLLGPDKTLNPENYYIIIPALLGNSESTSPSNWIHKGSKPFPRVTFYDNVRAQRLLVKHLLGEEGRLYAVVGWSMGAGQSYQWATQFPDLMDVVVPFCGSARTSLHNQVFLEGVKAALLGPRGASSGGICEGDVYAEGEGGYRAWGEGERETGLKALGRVYAGWGFSQSFYRSKLHESALGFRDLEDFMKNFWEAWALSKDPENMLTLLHTWQSGDVSLQEPYNGDFAAAMKGIKAKALVLPSKTDLYFPPEDSEIEVELMRPGIGELKVFPSIWGHWAGGPGDSKDDVKWLDDNLREFFAKNPPRGGAGEEKK